MKPYSSIDLPSGLESLVDMALDLRWTVRQTTDRIWEMLDAEAWEKTKNPYLILQNVSRARLEEVARNEKFIEEISNWQRMKEGLLESSKFPQASTASPAWPTSAWSSACLKLCPSTQEGWAF